MIGYTRTVANVDVRLDFSDLGQRRCELPFAQPEQRFVASDTVPKRWTFARARFSSL